ncbi:MAG: peptide-methionine (S)-S-oxide reductase MsrA [Rickettsiales bacterium]|nr:peptide-methionine (S)-S-oxide reductase MsrA [Rickettsiales bacterium]
MDNKTERAIFAGGCFWCTEAEFQGTPGVVSVTSGYIGGQVENPTYEQVSSGHTGHAEAIEVVYDPAVVTYEKLLDIYWGNIDPTDAGGQFYDRGSQYRTEIFYTSEEQRRAAELSRDAKQKKLGLAIATAITKAAIFYPAEEYHQDYYKKNPLRYNAYKTGSGREEKLKTLWKD